jgi:alpha-glucosidase
MANQYHWWQKGVIYQVYPRSFQDSNGDGIGDLPGIITRLDYIKNLGVECVWLSPIYPSPMHDFGYDVADYCDIEPMFGTLADFDQLLAETHQRGMKLILDLVPNHSSDEHEWFIESRSSRDNPKHDWYIWRDPAPDGGPPNNWLSVFGGPAWTFDETRGQYYLHQFVRQQPELNYRNPEVLAAMLDVMRFWLDKGVDGFRVDVIWFMIKDALFRDEPPEPNWAGGVPYNSLQHIYTQNMPEVHDVIKAMRAVLDSYDERMMVGEIFLPVDKLMKYYGDNLDECHLPFNFQFLARGGDFNAPTLWNAQLMRRIVDDYEAALPAGGWPNWVLGNHDCHRMATRFGPANVRSATMLLLTLRGTPTCYYGDELGMENVPIPPEFLQDPPAVNQPELADIVGRDPARTPMQWDGGPNAGFSTPEAQLWLPLAADYAERNVARQETDPTSMLSLFRALIQLRQAEPALHVGDYTAIESGHDQVFAYLRTAPGADKFMVVLNFGADGPALDLSHTAAAAQVALSTGMRRSGEVDLSSLLLAANEGLILRL